jgi:hypothetical protein
MQKLPPHFIVPAIILLAGARTFYHSDNRVMTGLLILTVAIVVGLVCSGGLILYERVFGRIEC